MVGSPLSYINTTFLTFSKVIGCSLVSLQFLRRSGEKNVYMYVYPSQQSNIFEEAFFSYGRVVISVRPHHHILSLCTIFRIFRTKEKYERIQTLPASRPTGRQSTWPSRKRVFGWEHIGCSNINSTRDLTSQCRQLLYVGETPIVILYRAHNTLRLR